MKLSEQLKQDDESGDFGKTLEGYSERAALLEKALATLAQYFTSGNSIPVDQATIKAADFWSITGMTPNNELTGRTTGHD